MFKKILRDALIGALSENSSTQKFSVTRAPTQRKTVKKDEYPTHSPLYKDAKMTEYICSYCGIKMSRHADCGRPNPGRCPRRPGNKPHIWRINRRY